MDGGWVPLYLVADDAGEVTARVAGLRTCGSPWACPLCSPVEAERRAEALARVVSRLVAQGWGVAHAVLTVRHAAGQPLVDVLGALGRAWRRLVGHRRVRALLREGVEFHRGVEVTWGSGAGWHPHLHLLFVAPPGIDLWSLEEPLWEAWSSAVLGVGWAPSSRDAYHYEVVADPREAVQVARYQEKWGVVPESAGGPLKRTSSGLTPWDLLGAWAAGHDWGEGEEWEGSPPLTFREFCSRALYKAKSRGLTPEMAGLLWLEYAEATKGRKRATSSRGLERLLREALEEVEREGHQGYLLQVVHLARGAHLWLMRSMRLAYLLHLAETLVDIPAACRLMGLVEGEEWRLAWDGRAPPGEVGSTPPVV